MIYTIPYEVGLCFGSLLRVISRQNSLICGRIIGIYMQISQSIVGMTEFFFSGVNVCCWMVLMTCVFWLCCFIKGYLCSFRV
jgi:hypothetical protein